MRRMLLLTALVPISALAQAPTLPDVVVTATRVPTLIERIPAGVSVIDRATIEASGYSTLTEALATVPGVRVVQSGGNGGNASLFIRGTNSNHVLVLRDGVPVNDPSDPGGLFNFGVDSLADVERIEVIRGPMSSLYGSGAIGGVINLITRRGKARRKARPSSPPACPPRPAPPPPSPARRGGSTTASPPRRATRPASTPRRAARASTPAPATPTAPPAPPSISARSSPRRPAQPPSCAPAHRPSCSIPWASRPMTPIPTAASIPR